MLAGRNPAARARARRALGLLLGWTQSSDSPWSSSTLTMHGSPVEFGFDSRGDALRYCVEIDDPGNHPGTRLPQAIRLLARVGATGVDDSVLHQMQRLQAARVLRFGAWIGGRHTPDADRYKLYVEVPAESAAEAHQWSATIAGPLSLPGGQRCRVGLIGYDVNSRRIEFYYRGRNLLPTTIALLLRRAEMEWRMGEVIDCLERVYRFSRAGRLPSRDVGFSYATPIDGGEATFSIYFFCLALFGGDGSARGRILQLAAAHDWRMSAYERLSEPIASARGTPTRHGMLGVVLRPEAAVGITVGLSPPEGTVA